MSQMRKSRWAKVAIVLMMAAVVFVSVARGMTICLCDDDPDGCGKVCHECASGDEDCVHVDVGAADLISSDVASAFAAVECCWFVATDFAEPLPLTVDAARPRAQAPPNPARFSAAFLRPRLQPLS